MSRILVLLSGYPCARSPWGNSQNHGTPDTSAFAPFYSGAEYLKKLLKGNSADYICTTWDDVGKDQIRNTYEPVIYQSFSQDNFREEIDKVLFNFEAERMKRRTEYYREYGLENDLVVSSIRFASQLKSRCSAAKLALELIDGISNSYDAILLTRYDISTRGGFLVRHPTFLEERDYSYLSSAIGGPKFITPSFGQLNCGFPDMWFYMNLAGLKHYSLIFDKYISDITSSSSEYFRMMTEGWPFSQKFPMHSIYDYRQYSNEIYKKNVGAPLMTYPDWEVSNLHSYHKYYLYLSSVLPPGAGVKFKNFFDVTKAFWANSDLNSNKRGVFVELISYFKSLVKIFMSRFAFGVK